VPKLVQVGIQLAAVDDQAVLERLVQDLINRLVR